MRRVNRAFWIAAVGFLATSGCRDMEYLGEMSGGSRQADKGRFTYMRELGNPNPRWKNYEPCTIGDLKASPRAWQDRFLEIRVVFHELHDVSLNYYTRYAAATHLGFSAWDAGARLWQDAQWEAGHPYFFASRTQPAADIVAGLRKYQNAVLYARGTDLFGDSLCVEVIDVKPLDDIHYTDGILADLRAGDAALRARNWATAREAFRRAAQAPAPRPGLAFAWGGLAQAAEEAKAWDEAAAAYDRSLEFAPDNPLYAWRAGRAYMMLESWPPAVDRLERCERLLAGIAASGSAPPWMAPALHDAKLCLATCRAQRGDLSAAIKGLEELLEKNPREALILNNLADALLRDGRDAKRALELASKAASLRPNLPQVQHTLGWAHLANKQPDQAVAALERAHRGASDNAEIGFHYAQALVQTGKPVAARALLAKIQESKTSWAGRAANLIGDIDAAEKKLFEDKKRIEEKKKPGPEKKT